ncbi:TetR family transcriptional regulator [Dinghuibacter silviterrae]|uniref:TetR family transcriptional regulator n=2 Tax=Dinghuibacter silviterrae TaxID=1539049 RepID=A0A4R8DQ84_9BACT|nr:TetR family transcriptional regulator [Dinghuibacter silviterrae]
MDVKERIQEKATELFMRFGVKSITMDEIASQLGVSKKTIYQYFADKEELVQSMIDRKLQASREECMRVVGSGENAIHEEFLNQDNFLEHLRTLNPVAIHDMEKFHPEAFKKVNCHRHTFMRGIVEKNLQKGIAEGLYRPEIRIDILSRARVDAIHLNLHADFYSEVSFSLADLQQELFIHYLYGIASPEGNKLIHRYLKERQQKPVVPVTPPIGQTGS